MSFRAGWPPVDELMRLGGITLLLQVIAFAYEWNYSGRLVGFLYLHMKFTDLKIIVVTVLRAKITEAYDNIFYMRVTLNSLLLFVFSLV